jgi:hypothetical protein
MDHAVKLWGMRYTRFLCESIKTYARAKGGLGVGVTVTESSLIVLNVVSFKKKANVLYKRVAHISEWPTTKSTYNPENTSLPKAPSINEILHSLEIGLLSS